MKAMRGWTACLLALAMVGCKSDGGGATRPAASIASSANSSAAVVVQVTASKKGFSPPLVTLQKGKPGVLVFTRTDDTECVNAVQMPFLKTTVPLPKDKPVRIEVPTSEDGTFRYSCWMSMLFGRVVIKP